MDLMQVRQPVSDSCQDVVEFKGKSFNSMAEVIVWVEEVPEEDRYRRQSAIMERMMTYHNRTSDFAEEVFTYAKSSKVYSHHITESEFEKQWEELQKIVEHNVARRDRAREARSKICQHWTGTDSMAWIDSLINASASLLASIRTLSKTVSFSAAVPRINAAVISRLSMTRRGVSTKREVQTGDIDVARKYSSEPSQPSIQTLLQYGLQLGVHGIVEAAEPQEGQNLHLGIAFNPRVALPWGVDFPSPAGEIPPAPILPISLPQSAKAKAEVKESGSKSRNLRGGLEDMDDEVEDLPDAKAASEYELDIDSTARVEKKHCLCSQDVTAAWKSLATKRAKLGLAADMRLLSRMVEYKTVCYFHLVAIGGHIGLRVKGLNQEQLRERLERVYAQREQLGKLKTDQSTFSWFRMTHRPAHPTDRLGPYKFFPLVENTKFQYDRTAILNSIRPSLLPQWEKDGTVNVDLFSWWFDCAIGDIVLEEFDMYRHHLRKVNGKSNVGWLRSMFFGIGQQLMRQDPMYYRLYAALRPDHQWRLVSYPYYAKYAVQGDNTYFRHLDLNIPDLLQSGRGGCIIQGCLSLDYEDEHNCTVLIPGMQHKLGEWWQRVTRRGQQTDGFLHRITETMFPPADAEALGLDWQRIPCQRGEVKVFVPHLPHGADGTTSDVRRTMFPWYVGVQDDHETLDVIEGGTWSDLALSHRDLTAPKATPSGLPNRHGIIPYRFPAAVEIAGLGALSDALVCRRRWDSPLVIQERNLILGTDFARTDAYVQEWRAQAVAVAIAAFSVVREEEIRVFGVKSYFWNKQQAELTGQPMVDIEPDSNVIEEKDVIEERDVTHQSGVSLEDSEEEWGASPQSQVSSNYINSSSGYDSEYKDTTDGGSSDEDMIDGGSNDEDIEIDFTSLKGRKRRRGH
jgi:hypothetical protein